MSKVLKCAHCQYSTTRTYNLKRHQLAKHPDATIIEQLAEPESQNVFVEAPNVFLNEIQNETEVPQNVFQTLDSTVLRNQCNKCDKCFCKSSNLKRHMEICKGKILPNQCPKCLKIYSSRQNKHIHMKRCKADNSTSQPTTIHNITNNNITNNNITNNVVNNDNRVINVVINSFGNESLDHITTDYMHKRLMDINGKGVVKFVKDVHFNPKIPENHNIRKQNNKELRVYENSEWQIKPLRWTVVDIIKQFTNNLKNIMYEDDFKRYVNDNTTWIQITDNYSKFSEKTNPMDFWRSVREVIDALENIERLYHDADNSL